jgi:hypothetical protein
LHELQYRSLSPPKNAQKKKKNGLPQAKTLTMTDVKAGLRKLLDKDDVESEYDGLLRMTNSVIGEMMQQYRDTSTRDWGQLSQNVTDWGTSILERRMASSATNIPIGLAKKRWIASTCLSRHWGNCHRKEQAGNIHKKSK